MRDKILVLLLVYLISFSVVHADSFQFPTARADALGGTALLSAPTPTEQLLSGTQMAPTEKLSFEFGYQRQYDLKELDLLYSAFSYKIKNYNFLLGFAQLGDPSIYTQKNIRAGLLYSNSFFTVGSFLTHESHDFNKHYQSLNQTAVGFSLQFRYKVFIINALLDNINQPLLTESSQKLDRKLTIFAELLGNAYYKTTLKFSTRKGYDNKFGIGESLKISRIGTLMFGFSTAPIEFGGGFEVRWNKSDLIYNSSYHPVLGFTHTMSFVVTLLDN